MSIYGWRPDEGGGVGEITTSTPAVLTITNSTGPTVGIASSGGGGGITTIDSSTGVNIANPNGPTTSVNLPLASHHHDILQWHLLNGEWVVNDPDCVELGTNSAAPPFAVSIGKDCISTGTKKAVNIGDACQEEDGILVKSQDAKVHSNPSSLLFTWASVVTEISPNYIVIAHTTDFSVAGPSIVLATHASLNGSIIQGDNIVLSTHDSHQITTALHEILLETDRVSYNIQDLTGTPPAPGDFWIMSSNDGANYIPRLLSAVAPGGGITAVTSTGGTVTVTNPGGPTANLEVANPGITELSSSTGLVFTTDLITNARTVDLPTGLFDNQLLQWTAAEWKTSTDLNNTFLGHYGPGAQVTGSNNIVIARGEAVTQFGIGGNNNILIQTQTSGMHVTDLGIQLLSGVGLPETKILQIFGNTMRLWSGKTAPLSSPAFDYGLVDVHGDAGNVDIHVVGTPAAPSSGNWNLMSSDGVRDTQRMCGVTIGNGADASTDFAVNIGHQAGQNQRGNAGDPLTCEWSIALGPGAGTGPPSGATPHGRNNIFIGNHTGSNPTVPTTAANNVLAISTNAWSTWTETVPTTPGGLEFGTHSLLLSTKERLRTVDVLRSMKEELRLETYHGMVKVQPYADTQTTPGPNPGMVQETRHQPAGFYVKIIHPNDDSERTFNTPVSAGSYPIPFYQLDITWYGFSDLGFFPDPSNVAIMATDDGIHWEPMSFTDVLSASGALQAIIAAETAPLQAQITALTAEVSQLKIQADTLFAFLQLHFAGLPADPFP